MQPTRVERVRGVNDVLPDNYIADTYIKNILSNCFATSGYLPLDVPLIEYTELYLKKSGEDIVARLYDFIYRNRRLCLRPEFTASVVRAYLDNLIDQPLPLRLYYHGPAFRYDNPEKVKHRQFTQMGIELIGATGAIADAEVIATACQGLNHLGLTEYKLVIGHIGVLNQFLDNLGLENRLRSFLLTNMETLRKAGKHQLEEKLHEIYPAFAVDETEIPAYSGRKLTDVLQAMETTEARQAVFEMLASMNIGIQGNRDPEEIVDRLLLKMQRQDQTKQTRQALEFMSKLGELRGEPQQVLQEAEKLLAAYGIGPDSLAQLRDIVEILAYYPINSQAITLDLGISRGLQYYTGMIFEIDYPFSDEPHQICGGGRYDDLVLTLGGQDTPATGFSYSLERLRQALHLANKLPAPQQPVNILVVPANTANQGNAIQIAETLRQNSFKVELDVKNQTVDANLVYAKQRQIPWLVTVNQPDNNYQEVNLINVTTGDRQNISVNDLIIYLKNLSN